jgi:chorismate mutase
VCAKQIEKIRQLIDQIDQELLILIRKRLTLTEQIGQIKRENHMDIVDLPREELLFSSLANRCEKLNLNKIFIKNLWRLILNASYLSQDESV